MKALGIHLLIEYYDCDPEVLDDCDRVRQCLLDAAELSGATILSHSFHRFSPQGISGVVVIAESHIAIHTWPEYGYAAVDIFTCGDEVNPWVAHRRLQELFRSGSSSVKKVIRGEKYGTGNKLKLNKL